MSKSRRFRRVFITGGAGFIGSHLSDEFLKKNSYVTVFDNLSSGKKEFLAKSLKSKKFTLIKGDLLDSRQLAEALDENYDIVFHLAANPDISKGQKDPSIDFSQTTIATFNLLQEIKKKNINNLVYFSGSGVYGDLGTKRVNENYAPLHPISMYGASKLSAEGMISAFSHLYGIASWIFRPANIIGDRATHGVIFDFINKLKNNSRKLEILGDGLQSKPYIHVSDVLHAVDVSLEKGSALINTYNIATNDHITVNNISEIIIKSMKLTNVNISHTKGRIGWPGDVAKVRLDTQKIRSLGWREKYNSKEAVIKTVNELLMED